MIRLHTEMTFKGIGVEYSFLGGHRTILFKRKIHGHAITPYLPFYVISIKSTNTMLQNLKLSEK